MKTYPLIGLGTWKLRGKECEESVKEALSLGYRHIDTADVYENHIEVGEAIASFPREELFLTSKLWDYDLKDPAKAVLRFLKELNTPYLDLLLIHWPFKDHNLVNALMEMNKLRESGVIRNIGISNFVISHLEMLDPYHLPIFTNQIEMHPYLQRKELVKECLKRGIKVTAYRPLAEGAFEKDPVMVKIGQKHKKTASQVALRWLTQQNIVAIPKAAKLQHLKDNLQILDFELDPQDFKDIETLDRGQRYCAPEGLPVYDDLER